MTELHDYQSRMIEDLRRSLRTYHSVLAQAPTGAGKTVLASFMLNGAVRNSRRSWFVCHRRELIDQTAKTFDRISLPYGFIAADYMPNPYAPIQICSVDTLKTRLAKIPLPLLPHFVVWDEAHHVGAAGWAAVKQKLSTAKHVGLSATPERLDGRGLGEHFEHMVLGPTTDELIKRGFLSDYRLFCPGTPDLSGIRNAHGDYAKGQLEDALLTQRAIIGDIVKHWRKYALGKRTIGFAASVKHSQAIVEQFRAAGIMALHLDGTTPKHERKLASQAFARGQIDVLMNVDLFGEGYDLAAQCDMDVTVEAVILARPTQSLGLHLQQVGRALRKKPQPAIILDHAGNWQRHGLPDDPREWSLEGKDKRDSGDEKTVPTRQCQRCYAVHRPAPQCPFCGFVYPVQGRVVEQLDGDLVELDKDRARELRLREQGQARSLDALIKLAEQRGYKNPEKWAAAVWTAREAKKQERFSRA